MRDMGGSSAPADGDDNVRIARHDIGLAVAFAYAETILKPPGIA
jgi:hypothetical protein